MPVGNIYKLIVPLDAEGLRFDRPGDQVLWRKLTNVVLRDGFIETRPGLTAVGPMAQDLTNLPAPIVSLQESIQWQNIGTAFAGGTGAPNETLAPNSDTGGSWTGTFADIDEDPPNNGVTKLVSTDRNDTVKIGFTNTTNSYDIVDHVYVYVRVRSPNGGQNILEIAKQNTATESGDVSTTPAADIYANLVVSNGPYVDFNTEGSEEGWMDFFVPLPLPTSGSIVFWNNAAVNAAAVDVTLRIRTFPHTTFYGPSATGSDNDFDNTDGWKHPFGLNAPLVFFADDATYVTGSTGDRISLTYAGLPASTLINTIDSITVRFALATPGETPTTVKIYHKGTDGVRRDVVATTRINQVHRSFTPYINTQFTGWQFLGHGATIPLNPETGLAWTLTEIKAGPEFGIEVVTGTVNMTSSDVWVTGEASSDVVEIDNMQLIVIGREFTGDNSSDTRMGVFGRIMATGYGFQRLVNEYADGSDTLSPLEDISSGISFPENNFHPLGHAFFFNRIYWQNGSEAPFFYEGTTIGQLSSSTPIGQTIWSFGQRLMQADITETVGGVTTRHTKRVAWSGIAGPDEWQATDSGSLDLTDGGQGRARKGLALSSQIAAIYLDKGIYNLRWTGDSAAPFSPRLQDSDTGIIAPATLQRVMDVAGNAIHMFLGNGPQGVNIYAYDGNQAQPVGGQIKDELNRIYRAGKAEWAFAELEPRLNLYMLFLPETGQNWPSQAWVFNIGTNAWVRWEFPFDITASGKWTLSGLTFPALDPDVDGLAGKQSMVMGTSVGVPYKWDFNTASDFLTPRPALQGDNDDFFNFDDTFGTQQEQGILWDIQTGDLVISKGDIIRQTTIKRVWITYEDRGFCDVEFSESIDSGTSWVNVVNARLGTVGPETISENDERPLRELIVDFPLPRAARHHRLRLRPDQTAITENEDFANARQKLKLSKIVIEYEDLGEAP